MAKTPQWTYDSIRNDILQRRFYPIYLLMGEEAYFIDAITDLLVDSVLTETEKDFNLYTYYGVDSDVNTVISTARRFPMMSEWQLVIVKEAQHLENLELLDLYAKQPMASTVLVINYKHGNVDRRKAFVKKINEVGVLFESKKLYENQVPPFNLLVQRKRNRDRLKVGADAHRPRGEQHQPIDPSTSKVGGLPE